MFVRLTRPNDPAEDWWPSDPAEFSHDGKFFMAFFGSMMALMLIGFNFAPLRIEVQCVAALIVLAVGFVLSLMRRREVGWRWRGAEWEHVFKALLYLVLIAVFAGLVMLLAPLSDPITLPWYLGLFGIGLFTALQQLRIVRFSEAAFLSESDPHWRHTLNPPRDDAP